MASPFHKVYATSLTWAEEEDSKEGAIVSEEDCTQFAIMWGGEGGESPATPAAIAEFPLSPYCLKQLWRLKTYCQDERK